MIKNNKKYKKNDKKQQKTTSTKKKKKKLQKHPNKQTNKTNWQGIKPSAEVMQLLVSQVMTSAQVVQRVSHYEKQSFSELYPPRTNILQSTKQ